jgi:hypothetical protein
MISEIEMSEAAKFMRDNTNGGLVVKETNLKGGSVRIDMEEGHSYTLDTDDLKMLDRYNFKPRTKFQEVEMASIPPQPYTEHPEDLLVWPDGDTAERSDYEKGDFDWKSDDFNVVPVDQRVDGFWDGITVSEKIEQLMIALKSMNRVAIVHYDNDHTCLEMGVVGLTLADGFTGELRDIASKVILREVPEAREGVRSFGEVMLDPEKGVIFFGGKTVHGHYTDITDEDGIWIDPKDLNEAKAEESPTP